MIPRTRTLRATHSPPASPRPLITYLVYFLLTVALIYTLVFPFSLSWSLPDYAAFGQLHTAVFAGNAGLLALILNHMRRRSDIPLRFLWSGALLIVAHTLTVLTATMWIPAYTAEHAVIHPGMAVYVLILLCGNFSLMATVPWWTWPRFQLLRLVADTVMTMSVIDLVLTVVLPSVVPGWVWTPALTAAVFRLETSIGLCFWYATVYRRFGGFVHPSVRYWSVGIVSMMLTDAGLLWGTLKLEQGETARLLGAAMPFWMVHQTMWTLGLAGVLHAVPSWRATPIAPVSQSSRWPPALRQGLLLVVLAIVAASSLRATVWFVVAVALRQLVHSYELHKGQMELAQANTILSEKNEELAQAQRQLEQLNGDLAAANRRLQAAGEQQTQLLIHHQQTAVALAHDMSGFLQDTLLALTRIQRSRGLVDEAAPGNFDHQVGVARQGLSAANELLSAMVAAAQLEAGMLHLRLAPLPAAALITDVARQLQPRAEHVNIQLTVAVDETLPHVLVDQALARRALLNIVGNALKYTAIRQKTGAGLVTITAVAVAPHLVVTVADNGSGIAPADLERLGQRFVRGHVDASTPAGSGLGLAFARGVIEQHPGGELLLDSIIDVGTTVTIKLPLATD